MKNQKKVEALRLKTQKTQMKNRQRQKTENERDLRTESKGEDRREK